MTEYVLGFLFDAGRNFVSLIRKERPDWQKGRWNGIGGKIEQGEEPEAAMRREFVEETGVSVDNWEPFATLSTKAFRLYCFRAFDDAVFDVATVTDEYVDTWLVDNVAVGDCLPNLHWLIPMALHQTGHTNIQQ